MTEPTILAGSSAILMAATLWLVLVTARMIRERRRRRLLNHLNWNGPRRRGRA